MAVRPTGRTVRVAHRRVLGAAPRLSLEKLDKSYNLLFAAAVILLVTALSFGAWRLLLLARARNELFDDNVKFVVYYVWRPKCTHCEAFNSVWDQFQDEITKVGGKGLKVNAKEPDVAPMNVVDYIESDVTGVPAIFAESKGEPGVYKVYRGARTIVDLTMWLDEVIEFAEGPEEAADDEGDE